jgi:two-component system, OmpR family, alkaline phosphatase synthesis response regulator PhoP
MQERLNLAQGSKILVCSDEWHIVRLIQVNLERQGYGAGPARSGVEAIRLMTDEPFDLVILDPDIPGMNADEVRAWIREQPQLAHLKVVMLEEERKPFR